MYETLEVFIESSGFIELLRLRCIEKVGKFWGLVRVCNSPNLPLVDIVHFSQLRIVINFMVLKRVY